MNSKPRPRCDYCRRRFRRRYHRHGNMYCGVTCKQGSLVEGALIREGRAADRLHLYTANDRALTGEPRLTVKADGTWVVS